MRQGGAESLATLSARFEGRAFSSPEPLGGRIALVFPGSGSAFAGMGRALARAFPAIAAEDLDLEVLRPDIFWRGSPDAVAGATPCQKILAQVGLGRLTARALDRLGVPWSATLGYSLGESTQLVAADIWPDLEGLRQDLLLSSLFTHDLVEPWRAARIHFRLRPDDDFRWANALLLADASEALRSLAGQDRVFLLASLAPGECVVGGGAGAGRLAGPLRRSLHAAGRLDGGPLLRGASVRRRLPPTAPPSRTKAPRSGCLFHRDRPVGTP